MIDGDVERDDRDFFRLKIHLFDTFLVKNAYFQKYRNVWVIYIDYAQDFDHVSREDDRYTNGDHRISIQNELFSNKNGLHFTQKAVEFLET